MATSCKLEGLDQTLEKTFSVVGCAALQLVPTSAVRSLLLEVSKTMADPAHHNCPASSGRRDPHDDLQRYSSTQLFHQE